MDRRVAITGLGVVSGLGIGIDALWEGLVGGRSALAQITRFDPAGFRSKHAAEADVSAKGYVPKSYRKAVKVMARDIELAVVAARLAVDEAGLVTVGSDAGQPTYARERLGCQIGAGLIAADVPELTRALASSTDETGAFSLPAWGTNDDGEEMGIGDNGGGGMGGGGMGRGGMNNLPPLWLLKYLPNMPACHVTIIHGAGGPSNTITCAEAGGLLSIGESTRVIQRDDADACLSGGAESRVNLMGLLRLDLAGRLATTAGEREGWRFVRPYDPESPGSLIGEAGAILVLEDIDSAKRRGAPMLAEILGFGSAQSDAPYPPPPPLPSLPTAAIPPALGDADRGNNPDEGLIAAIESALADAGVDPAQIDAIVPHGSGAPSIDEPEAGALRRIFGDRLARIPLVTLIPFIGECMSGAGGLQVAAGAMCLKEQRLPARLNAGVPAGELNAGACESVPADLSHVLVCSGSLGGQNAALVLGRVS